MPETIIIRLWISPSGKLVWRLHIQSGAETQDHLFHSTAYLLEWLQQHYAGFERFSGRGLH